MKEENGGKEQGEAGKSGDSKKRESEDVEGPMAT